MNLDDAEPKKESAKKADDVSAETMRDIATSAPAKTLDTVAAATNAVAPDATAEDEERKDGEGEQDLPGDDAKEPSPDA